MIRFLADSSGFDSFSDINAARRQLRMSLSVVAVLTVGIVTAGLTFGAHPLSAKRDVVSAPSITVLHADTNVVGAVRS